MTARLRRAGPLLLGLLVLARAGSALAENPEVKRYLSSAVILYENLEYEQALKQLSRAKDKAGSPEDEIAIALYEGIVLSELGKEEPAIGAFKVALSMDPEAKLPVVVSPKIEATFEQTRAAVKKLATQLRPDKTTRPQSEAPRPPPPRVAAPAGLARPEPMPGVRRYAWAPVVGGAALAGVGTYLLIQAEAHYRALYNGTFSPPSAAAAYRDEGKRQQALGSVLVGVGAAGLAVGGFLAFAGGSGPRVSLSGGNGLAYVGLAGPLP